MNWLFLLSRKSDSIEEVTKILVDKNAIVSSLNIDEMDSSSVDFTLIEKLESADYVVLNLEGEQLNNSNYIFVLGYLFGKKVPFFSNNKINDSFDYTFYKDISDLKKILKKRIKEFIAIVEKNKALKILEEEKKIPFTPDFFSFEISKNNMETAKLYLKAGMSVNERDCTGTPMICVATRTERIKMIKWLLENGADINAVSKDRGYSALMDAVWRSDEKIVEFLLSKGADVNIVGSDGQSALIIATGIGKEKICQMLSNAGADPNFKDHMNMSSIDYATLFKKENLVKIYKENSK